MRAAAEARGGNGRPPWPGRPACRPQPPSRWALLAVINVLLVVVPWMLLCAIERTGHLGRHPNAPRDLD